MKHLTIKERYYIEVALRKKTPVASIADALGYSRVTIYKEIEQGQCEQYGRDLKKMVVYLSDYAQRKHDEKVAHKGRKKKLSKDSPMLQQVRELIGEQKYSPEAALYKIENRECCIKTIYNYIHAGYLNGITVESLPYTPKKKKKTQVVKREYKPKGRSIEERPKEINRRETVGHWEMDTVYSSHDDKACLLVLTERKTRKEIMRKMPDRTAVSVGRCLDRLERQMGCRKFRETFKTITCDNGKEFNFEIIEKSIRNKTPRTVTYFCHPYASGERGSNEKQNAMIRRWIPKGDDIGLYTDAEIQAIEDWLNAYPRKLFEGKSSLEVAQ